jgi:trans-feruloyl-CoA hydratase/vanillin synthase
MNTATTAPAAAERAEADTVSFTVAEQIAWVQFNRPEKRNCMSPKLNRQMLRVLDELEFRNDVGVLVLSGEGDAWSAGMDLKEYFREVEQQGLGAVRGAQRESYGWWRRLRWYQKPTIAMVNGWCFGGGYGPLFACDLAFAAEEAQFGLSEINWGILPGGGATKIARELLSFRRAMYHSLMGENIDGKTAAANSRARSSPSIAEEKSGGAQGHERRRSARGRNDLRQCGGFSGTRPGGGQLLR